MRLPRHAVWTIGTLCAALLPGCSPPPPVIELGQPGSLPVSLEDALSSPAPTISVVEESRRSGRVAGAPVPGAAQLRQAPSGESDPVTTTRARAGSGSWSVPTGTGTTGSHVDVPMRRLTQPRGEIRALE
jgi:hypothetical protein